jgi:hypothetical protein
MTLYYLRIRITDVQAYLGLFSFLRFVQTFLVMP